MRTETRTLWAVALLVLGAGVVVAAYLPTGFPGPTVYADCERNPHLCDARVPLRLGIALGAGLIAAAIATLSAFLPGNDVSGGFRVLRPRTVVAGLRVLAVVLLVAGVLGWTLTATVVTDGMDPIVEQGPSIASMTARLAGVLAGLVLFVVSKRVSDRA